LFKRALFGITGPQELIPPRSGSGAGTVHVTEDTAMRHSAVWACLRLRADLESTMPIDVFRRVGEIQVEMPKPPILVNPGGERVDICEWMYSSRVDLDRGGNSFGLITERNAANLPNRIDLQPLSECTVRIKNGEIEKYRIGQYQSAQKFALDWFGTGGVPKGHLKNTELATLDPENAQIIKTRYKASVENNDVFVSGKDWEYSPFQAEAVGAEWLEAQKFGIGDIARFFGCPGDLIDAAVSTGSITYANITQRNLQFLIMNLGPAIIRRERALSKLLPQPRYVKLNTSSLLRMDDATRAALIKTQIDSRTLTPSEARELDNRAPLTAEQIAEFDQLFGKKNPAPVQQEPRSKAEITAELQRLWLEYQVQELSGEVPAITRSVE
jgi:phage portal protein BeeE